MSNKVSDLKLEVGRGEVYVSHPKIGRRCVNKEFFNIALLNWETLEKEKKRLEAIARDKKVYGEGK